MELQSIFPGLTPIELSIGLNNELYVEFEEADFVKAIDLIYNERFTLASLFATSSNGGSHELLYIFSKISLPNWLVIRRPVHQAPSSIALKFPSAVWCEREISDGFGITFQNSIDNRRLFLHEIYPHTFHPFLNTQLDVELMNEIQNEEYEFRKFTGEGIYQIPVGPVHAGIIEPGHFRFSVIGETIYNLEVRMFYKHRGIEKFMEGKTPNECLPIIAKISGDETVGNTVAFCNAIEKLSGVNLTDKALILRTILLEMERMYSHLNDIAGMILDVSFAMSSSLIYTLREELFRWNKRITGHRFMRGIIILGGVGSIDGSAIEEFKTYLPHFMKRFEDAINIAKKTSTVIDRFESTGIVKSSLIQPLHLTGPIARASGFEIDTRTNHPYGIYEELLTKPNIEQDGDVFARFNVKSAEVLTSAKMIILLQTQLPENDNNAVDVSIKDGRIISAVEVSRGENLQFVSVKNGKIDRFKVRTASFFNWKAIEHAVIGNIVADFPLINKSMNLSYAGTDL